VRVVTLNLLARAFADGAARHAAVKKVLPDLRADVVALQEVHRGDDFDQAADLVGPGFTIVDVPGGHPTYGGECLAVRHPLIGVHTLDQPMDRGSARATALAVEIAGPDGAGPLVVVHHKGTFELGREGVREQQALATARFVADLAGGRPKLPVVLVGDFNAAPDAASIRFLTGRQSLAGGGVHYRDAWTAVHPDLPGHTVDPDNPLVRDGEMPLEPGRRIDYVLVRCGIHGPLLTVADCRLIFTAPVGGVWASDHYGVLADLR
jgi:endonuclease/exonuclease/phosphatase family metal-dependent hydrolase